MTPLISLRSVTKTYSGPAGKPIPVLEGIDLQVADGEFVALLGRSGSGKSTLLRCIAGLIAPSTGEVDFAGSPVRGTNRRTAMVFQTFALLPWLTVQQNVEIGLEARKVAASARAERAVRAIDLVGLDGYETAFPKELSGGMRQRVGFARALVVEPDALLMDEPFSALDVLTAENLRGELLELWEGHRFPTRSIVMVTHNIEEAVLLADRILVLGSNPGRIRAELRVELPRPRQRRTPEFDALVDRIYAIMTERPQPRPQEPAAHAAPERGTPGDTPLPHATVDGLSGLAEILQNRGGAADLADIADVLGLEIGDLLALVDALVMLGFGESDQDEFRLTATGAVFAGASIQDSKEIFAAAVLARAPLVRTIDGALHGARDGNLPSGFFVDILRRSFGEEEARQQLDVAINWGRYAELYSFDAARGQVIREEHVDRADTAAPEEAPPRGGLLVYLGAAPGAGTTFAMLRDGQTRRARGEDVVIGDVETHGRPRTIEAIGDLELVPDREPGAARQLDLDALLARRPDVVLVDDLACENPPAARNPKRWQDVDALRDAGIHVIATLDVRHVESVKDLAERATGDRVAETVPDAVLEGAEEVQFVDISPEALRKRIGHGNVYPRDQVEERLRALPPARLQALREIALELMAQGIGSTRPGVRDEPQDVLVAVPDGPLAEAMVRRAARLARRTGGLCSVLHVVEPRRAEEGGAVARLSELAGQLGASLVVREGRDVAGAVAETVRELVAEHLVVGVSSRQRLLDATRRTIAERLVEDLPDIDVHVLGRFTRRHAGPAAGQERPDGERSAGSPGSLRVYLGYARGCGTTTAMLDEARRRKSRGTDVVVAAVATHGQPGVEEALGDLELVGDAASGAVDAGALLARNPQVACLDDLTASTIAAVPALLEAGITLIGTLHLPELDGAGRGAILDLADEVELVDLTPPALLERLRRGDIVPSADVPRALESGEFDPATLTAQREAAFRTVARRTGQRTRVLACVPPREGLERLIRDAATLAASIDGDFTAATVRTGTGTVGERQLLEAYAGLTEELGGRFVTLGGRSVAPALADYARENQVTELMVTRGRPHRRGRRSTLRELVRLATDVDIHVVSADR